ncbi:Pentatricopeptide repeat-containing protein [Hibiscus syriacus]|uniref:Pentatricopeptide repeat-containing protein n=1 Tax=Hibiscus syriacus TaxID=106335 RepID=A0A6A2WBS3_HIBSY|nr:Pentatricopeptide repeat-containing protein [Hibiscus syriacus]
MSASGIFKGGRLTVKNGGWLGMKACGIGKTWVQRWEADFSKHDESEALISQAVSKLKSRERDLTQFYCNLIESCSKHESKQGFNEAYGYLSELVRNSSSMYVKRQCFKSMVSILCEMGQPNEALNVVEDMRKNGVKPSLFEFRFLLYGYGKMGCFEDMERMVNKMEMEGFEVDTICSNMVLLSYGAFTKLSKIAFPANNYLFCEAAMTGMRSCSHEEKLMRSVSKQQKSERGEGGDGQVVSGWSFDVVIS